MSTPELTPEEAATVERFERAPDALVEDLRNEVAEVLAEHQRIHDGPGSCRCGTWPPPEHDVEWPHHLADALLPLIAQREAAARTEGAASVIAYPEQVLEAARAEALRDAAREVEERIVHVPDNDVDSGGFEVGMDVGCEIAYTEAARRLNERAARIARGDA